MEKQSNLSRALSQRAVTREASANKSPAAKDAIRHVIFRDALPAASKEPCVCVRGAWV